MPRPSAIPPLGDHRNRDGVGHRRHEREQSDEIAFGVGGREGAPVPTCLHSLGDDHIGARLLGLFGLGEGSDSREPSNPLGFRPPQVLGRKQTHDRGHGRGVRRQQGVELRAMKSGGTASPACAAGVGPPLGSRRRAPPLRARDRAAAPVQEPRG